MKYVDPDFQSVTLAAFESVSSGGFIELDLDLVHKDGSIHTYDISACPFQTASGETHTIVMMWDISEESINEAKVVIAEKRTDSCSKPVETRWRSCHRSTAGSWRSTVRIAG